MKKNKWSIRWQLFSYLALFVGLLLLVLWLFQVVFLEDFYKNIKIKEIKEAGTSIARNIENEDFEAMMNNLANRKDYCIVVSSENGRSVYSVDRLENCTIHYMSPIDYMIMFDKTLRNGGSALYYFSYSGEQIEKYKFNKFFMQVPSMLKKKEDTVIYTRIIPRVDGTNYLLMINGVITPVDATVSTIRRQFVYVAFIMLILAFLLALIIARKIALPIIKINKEAKKLPNQDEEVTFLGKGYREIEELSETLNYAAYEIARAEDLRRELIANVSHDLRTPLTLITGYAEVMRDLPGENTPENTQIIIDESKRLTQLVNDLLDLSKLQAGTIALNEVEFNLTQHIKEIFKRYTALIEQQSYQLTFEATKEVMIKGDVLKVSQVIYNLMNNAINYTGEDKRVEVKQILKEDRVRIEITDTGEGISEENLPYIWERYYKVDKTHKRATIGTGLGLSIVRSILEQHKANYGVISKLGEGSTFWFELPYVK